MNYSSATGLSIHQTVALKMLAKGMVQAWVDQKCLKRDILRLFYDVR